MFCPPRGAIKGISTWTIGMFIDLLRAFYTVDHTVLLQKLKLYSIRGSNHIKMKSFLSNSKQYTEIAPKTKVSLELVRCRVPQRSILTPLLLVLYVNDPKYCFTSPLSDNVYRQYKPLLYSHRNRHGLLSDVNKELIQTNGL